MKDGDKFLEDLHERIIQKDKYLRLALFQDAMKQKREREQARLARYELMTTMIREGRI